MGLLWAMRRIMGALFCKHWIVGAMRQRLARLPLDARWPVHAGSHAYTVETARREAVDVLALHCALCQRCDLGRSSAAR